MDVRLDACALPDDGDHGLERIRDAVILADLRQRVSELITATGTSPDVIPDKQRYLGGWVGLENISHPGVPADRRRGRGFFFAALCWGPWHLASFPTIDLRS